MAHDQIAVFGAGGFAREVAWLLSSLEAKSRYEFIGYVEDGADSGRILNRAPVLSWERLCREYPSATITIAVGDPTGRASIAQRCKDQGFSFPPIVHRSVEMSEFVELGAGCVICCGSILTTNIKLGEHVHINLDCTIGHDVRIGGFTTLSPGAHVSGNVHIGSGVFIGTGATIINGRPDDPLVIRDGAVIAAGACLTTSTEPNSLYAGVPASLKKRYG